ncbi:MAG: hypothetical protein KME22_07725 [Hassallia sp. WJT32-NPBG1]|jgi:hypothetical protein|nr:hypothetical protein [Hassallia sp. WJT32-NPBG1]
MIKQHIEDFKSLEMGSKICLIGSWVAASGAALLICTSAITVAHWMQGDEPDSNLKKALTVGLGLTVGGAIFTIGVAMEDDRQCELSAENVWKAIAERRALREASPCPNCKNFNNDCNLNCAINPLIACTPEATDCKDFESKEIN